MDLRPGEADFVRIGARPERRLPDFLGIGVPRAGATWLHDLLSSHPQVVMPKKRKELNLFDLNFHRGLDWDAACFPVGAVPARGSSGDG